MPLSDVSKTALFILASHVIDFKKKKSILNDRKAEYSLNKIISFLSKEDQNILLKTKLPAALESYIVLRARYYDSYVNEFIARNKDCIIVNLGCGFDMRYWRINHESCKYIELDLPDVIHLKKKALKEILCYKLIGRSVLDFSWINKIKIKKGKGNERSVLFIAEGLFMYLPKEDIIELFKKISENFSGSKIIFETVHEKYTHGIWKKIASIKMKKTLGFDAGSSYNFGIKNASEIESYAKGVKVTNEWSYFEDKDIRPKILKYFGSFKMFSRTQWTIEADL
ncbi:MAG: class I SAM-dependent methyltransferase [Spirochaetia bacterium]|nr:class I SAM-dependent methyltransferase [Spirochaetia bacterium]